MTKISVNKNSGDIEVIQMRRQRFSKFLFSGGKKVKWECGNDIPKKTTEGSTALTKLSSSKKENETLFSMEWKSEHSKYGMRGAVAQFGFEGL